MANFLRNVAYGSVMIMSFSILATIVAIMADLKSKPAWLELTKALVSWPVIAAILGGAGAHTFQVQIRELLTKAAAMGK